MEFMNQKIEEEYITVLLQHHATASAYHLFNSSFIKNVLGIARRPPNEKHRKSTT